MSKNPSERKRMPGEGEENLQRDTQQGQHKEKEKGSQDWNKDQKNQKMEQDRTKQGPRHNQPDSQAGDEGIDDRKRRPA